MGGRGEEGALMRGGGWPGEGNGRGKGEGAERGKGGGGWGLGVGGALILRMEGWDRMVCWS